MSTAPTPVGRASPRQVLIAGCGYVGTRLGELLAARGDHPVGLRRNPSGLPPSIEPLAVDLLAGDLESRIPPADLVVYAASADRSDESSYRRIYVDAVDALLRVFESREPDQRPSRLVFVSSTAVYGDAEGGWVDENTSPRPESFRGSVMVEGEDRVLGSPIPGVVLRLGGIYGPGRTRIIDLVRAGQARCPGDGPIWSNRIHREDAAAATMHLLDLPEPEDVYLGVDAEPTPLCQVYRWLAEQVGAPEPPKDPAVSRDRSNKRCSSERLQASGFAFRYPSFRDGYGEMLEESGP
ncbi:MAG: SDR family oxidoreductase [Gemmatimonadales bacterium]|nr:MAG: SDR family oxidoreductase [Gemmatimonadales bacterium]